MGFSRQAYWTGLPCPLLQGIFPTQGLNLCLLQLLHFRLTLYRWATGKPTYTRTYTHTHISATQRPNYLPFTDSPLPPDKPNTLKLLFYWFSPKQMYSFAILMYWSAGKNSQRWKWKYEPRDAGREQKPTSTLGLTKPGSSWALVFRPLKDQKDGNQSLFQMNTLI